jgi:pyruvate dehydrogenase E1 component
LSAVPRDAAIVTVIDGYPATLAWLGGVLGHRIESLGVDRFGQTGTVHDLYRHFGFDAEGIMRAVEAAGPGRPIRFRAG